MNKKRILFLIEELKGKIEDSLDIQEDILDIYLSLDAIKGELLK